MAVGILTEEPIMTRRALEEQFERLMRDHGASMARMASAYGAIPADRDDLLQEIAIALWKALPSFRGECSERTLIFRIAHNRAVSYLWRRRSISGDPDAASLVPDTRGTPESQAASRQLRNRLVDAIRRLAPAHRQVMVLVLEDMSHAEIAGVLGISEGNVAVRATRARKELRDLMGGLR
jgi:RNA polymerase sigma-70 factor (ECF subfamily)